MAATASTVTFVTVAVLAGLYIPRGTGSNFLTNLSHTSSLNMPSDRLTSRVHTPSDRRTRPMRMPAPVTFLDDSKAINHLNRVPQPSDYPTIGECSMAAPITENPVHSTAEYFIVEPIAAIDVFCNPAERTLFTDHAVAICKQLFHNNNSAIIYYACAYIKAGAKFKYLFVGNKSILKYPHRELFFGALLYAQFVC